MPQPVGIGLVGAGAFGEFCLAAFSELPDVRIAAIADLDVERVVEFAAHHGANAYASLDGLLADPQVDIVALNTPPHLHESQGLAVLRAGKHLFCEKPLALTVEGGATLLAAANENGLHLTVDYVMRRDPLWAAAAELRASGLLGAILHMSLSNHAAGLNLSPDHWFWDKRRSGGIWIEHGVHFFDAFAWVAGADGRVVAARQFARPDGTVDRVEALATYGEVAAHFYHGFTHSSATEQTTVDITFERGHVTLREWVPTVMEIVTSLELDALIPFLPGRIETATVSETMRRLTATLTEGKAAVYREAIQAGMSDLVRSVLDRDHAPAVTGLHGLDSLRMAVDAERLAAHSVE